MHRIGNKDYWEYYDAEVSEELFEEFLEKSSGFRNNNPRELLPGELFLVFWKREDKYLCALLTPLNISLGVTDKMNFTNPEYENNDTCFTLHRGYMNFSWFARRVI